jgi:hypothetical protein
VRSRLQALAAFFPGLGGGLTIPYAGLPPVPPLSSHPVPVARQELGVAGLAAAVGVFRRLAWGRWLGVIVVVIDLLLALSRAAASEPAASRGVAIEDSPRASGSMGACRGCG